MCDFLSLQFFKMILYKLSRYLTELYDIIFIFNC